jgi:hypothetical protein
MWRRVTGVAIFLDPEGIGNTIFGNVGNYAANDMASHHRSLESSGLILTGNWYGVMQEHTSRQVSAFTVYQLCLQ